MRISRSLLSKALALAACLSPASAFAFGLPGTPRESTTLNAALVAPPSPGTYTLEWDMVRENVTWFSAQGVPPGTRNVTVSSSAAPHATPPRK